MSIKNQNLTVDNLSQAVLFLLSEVATLKELLSGRSTKPGRMPIGIDEACRILGKAKPTVYCMVQKRLLPCYKNGKKLYFYEDELLESINSGKLTK